MKNELNRHVDSQLETPAQQAVRQVVQALPEEQPSLAWRSELNANLQKQSIRRRRLDFWGWFWKPSAGVAVAAGLALLVIARIPSSTADAPAPKGNLEQALVNSYIHSKTSWELTPDGVTANEAKDTEGSQEPDWFREDIGATL